jgi:predicted RNase H-like HicB family nuclease
MVGFINMRKTQPAIVVKQVEQMQVAMTFTLPAVIQKRRRWYVASCPLLDVHSQGSTEPDAQKNLVEALVEFFLSCFERGTLTQVLHDCGFMPVAEPPARPQRLPRGGTAVNVPVPFVIAKQALEHMEPCA